MSLTLRYVLWNDMLKLEKCWCDNAIIFPPSIPSIWPNNLITLFKTDHDIYIYQWIKVSFSGKFLFIFQYKCTLTQSIRALHISYSLRLLPHCLVGVPSYSQCGWHNCAPGQWTLDGAGTGPLPGYHRQVLPVWHGLWSGGS